MRLAGEPPPRYERPGERVYGDDGPPANSPFKESDRLARIAMTKAPDADTKEEQREDG